MTDGLVFDDDTNLLHVRAKERAARDADEANLYPELFPYREVPRVAFGAGEIPMRVPEEIFITDTTFR
ncbi:MAG TPA: 2-isopropylmalate synthase, partial [Clostridia bacterium]|nr:2-isopropylmalate synthase [Clostridia bacterium]